MERGEKKREWNERLWFCVGREIDRGIFFPSKGLGKRWFLIPPNSRVVSNIRTGIGTLSSLSSSRRRRFKGKVKEE